MTTIDVHDVRDDSNDGISRVLYFIRAIAKRDNAILRIHNNNSVDNTCGTIDDDAHDNSNEDVCEQQSTLFRSRCW
jgi:hypothetical protein